MPKTLHLLAPPCSSSPHRSVHEVTFKHACTTSGASSPLSARRETKHETQFLTPPAVEEPATALLHSPQRLKQSQGRALDVFLPEFLADLALNLLRVGLVGTLCLFFAIPHFTQHFCPAASTRATDVDLLVHVHRHALQVLTVRSLDAPLHGLIGCVPIFVHIGGPVRSVNSSTSLQEHVLLELGPAPPRASRSRRSSPPPGCPPR